MRQRQQHEATSIYTGPTSSIRILFDGRISSKDGHNRHNKMNKITEEDIRLIWEQINNQPEKKWALIADDGCMYIGTADDLVSFLLPETKFLKGQE